MKKSEFDKLLISKSKKGRSDGAYSRLFGDDELGALISRVHATSISAGAYLENLISNTAPQLGQADIPKLFNGTLGEGLWIISKKQLKKRVTPYLNLEKNMEPDFLIVDGFEKQCFVLELKDGDNFDTKKAQGEVNNLDKYSSAMNNKLAYPWTAKIKVCMFNQENHKKICEGFKGWIKEEDAMTGNELCKLLGLNKTEIIKQREQACSQNFPFFLEELVKIDLVREGLKRLVGDDLN